MQLTIQSEALRKACDLVVQGKVGEGINCLLDLATSWPGDCAIAHALGNAWRAAGDHPNARLWLARAAVLDPDDLLSWRDLADLAAKDRDWAELGRASENWARLAPHDPAAWVLWAHSLHARSRVYSALGVALRAWRSHHRGHAQLNAGIGSWYSETGKNQQGIFYLRKAVEIDPAYRDAWANLLFAVTSDVRTSAEDQAREHRRFGACYPAPASIAPRTRPPGSKMRVGYVSGDFRRHPLERFYAPILKNLDRERFDVFLYSNTWRCDASTERYRAWADEWRDITRDSDEEAQRRIIEDGIDILVDLSGHTRGNRLGIFARRAAAVQVTHCGYPNTTGLSQIDWLITDSRIDEPGAEKYFAESLLRMEGCFLCYSPALREIPAESCVSERPVTFGCFNPLRKISEDTLDLWARVMNKVPASRLMLKSRALEDVQVSGRIVREFRRRGIAPARIVCAGFSGTDEAYLRAHHEIDIALDPFPYNGGTITCDALWMGVPVVAKKGDTHASRVAAGLLYAAGLPNWIANSADDYARIAVRAASEVARLRASRQALRTQVARSELMDSQAYLKRYERALLSVSR